MAIAFLSNLTLVGMAHEDMQKKIPEDLDNYKKEDYPHFHVWSVNQLGKAMDYGQVKENSRIIANLSDDKILTVTFTELEEMGVNIHCDGYWD